VNEFKQLARTHAAPSLMQQFGDRDGNGVLQSAKYHPPYAQPGSPAIELSGAIWSDVRFEDLPDIESGGIMRREARTCRVMRSELDARGIDGFEFNAWVEDPSGDPDAGWTLEESTTVWGEVFVTLGLVRIPLVRKGEQRATV
jgi:hypothetical protein